MGYVDRRSGRGIEQRRCAAVQKDPQRVFQLEDVSVGTPSTLIPPTKQHEVPKRGRTSQSSSGRVGVGDEIEVVSHEPDHARRDETLEQVSANLGVVRKSYRFSNIVQQGSRPKRGIGGLRPRELECLQLVKQDVSFRMPARALQNSISP
jgi:hypothetical protein